MKLTFRKLIPTLAALCALAMNNITARASTAYGSINNFDVVNDTGSECHGFEIELEDCDSTDITYTYDWNHYGKSKLRNGTTALGKPACFVRWESAKNLDGSWAAYTAIPAAPLLPTNGHQFTNPNVNFGGEHFGVGYRRNPTAVRYFWLLDDGAGNLVRGAEVKVSTPVFNYQPIVGGVAAQVQAVIEPVVPELPEPKEFGDPVWVKEIRTTSHNNNEVKLRDLVSDDPDDDNDKNWRNGEPDEVEVEWQLLQVDYNKGDGGANAVLPAAPEELPDGELNTEYAARTVIIAGATPFTATTEGTLPEGMSFDPVTGVLSGTPSETGTFTYTVNAQEGALPVKTKTYSFVILGAGAPPPPQSVVDTSTQPANGGSTSGDGTFDNGTDITVNAVANPGFTFVNWTDNGNVVSNSASYTFTTNVNRSLVANFAPVAGNFTVSTSASPANLGTASGDGTFANGASVTVTATANAGAAFVAWTEGGNVVSSNASYTFNIAANRVLVANFVSVFNITTSASPNGSGTTTGGGAVNDGSNTTVTATANAGFAFVNWTEGGTQVSASPSYTFAASADRALVANFAAAPVGNVPAGSFKGIAWNAASPVAEGTGMVNVTTTGVAGRFTCNFLLGTTRHAFRSQLDATGHATVSVPRKGQAPLTVNVQYDAAQGITGSIADSVFASTFTARRIAYSKANPLTQWPGLYTHMIGFPRQPQPPLPVGTGTHLIADTGTVRVVGRLSDGSGYACSSAVTDAGSFPLYSPTKRPGFAGFLVGDAALDAANLGSITTGSPVTWKPASARAFGRFRFHADRYTPPARGQTALQVDPGVHNLNVFATNALGGGQAAWQMMLRSNNTAADLHTGPGRITLRIAPATGVVSGAYQDGAVMRQFTGVAWQSTNTGMMIVPGTGDQVTIRLAAIHTAP